jgi:hypothetical protein
VVALDRAKGLVSRHGRLMSREVVPVLIEKETQWVPGGAQLLRKFPLP